MDQYSEYHSLKDEYINRELFEKQAVFSISLDIKLKNFKYILKNKSVYYDFTKGEHYFLASENDPGYSHLLLEGEDIGLKFNKNEDVYWISFTGETMGNENMKKILNGKNLRSIEKGMMFPLILNRNERLYYVFQYSVEEENDVTENLLKIQNAYTEFYGPDSFRIEKISESEPLPDIFTYGYVDEPFYEIEILIPYDGPNMKGVLKRLSFEPKENQFMVKYDKTNYTLSFDDLTKNFQRPSISLFDAFKEISDRFAFPSYFEGVCENKICKVKWIYEERFLPDVLTVLNKINLSGGNIALSKIKKLNLEHKEIKENDLSFEPLNKEFFQKEIVYSKDLKYLPQLMDLIDNAIVYNDVMSMDVFLVVDKNSPKYPEIKIKSIKNNLKFNENKYFIWLSFPDISKIKDDLYDKTKNGRLFNLEGSYHLPFLIIKGGRIYYIDQYSTKFEKEVTTRILNVIKNHYDILGLNSFRVESIGNARDPLKFIRDFSIKTGIVSLELSIDYNGEDLKGIIKNISLDINQIQFLADEGQGPKVINISEINKKIPGFGDLAKLFFMNLQDNLSFLLYFEFKCNNGKCNINMLLEKNMFLIISNALVSLIDSGLKIKLSKYETLQ
ncbi:MAG: hypothetical protein ACP5TX_00025 [Thermoplasmata archaeon]